MGNGKHAPMVFAGLKGTKQEGDFYKKDGKTKAVFKIMKIGYPVNSIFAQEENSGEIFMEWANVKPAKVWSAGFSCVDVKGKMLIPMAYLKMVDGEEVWSEIEQEMKRHASC